MSHPSSDMATSCFEVDTVIARGTEHLADGGGSVGEGGGMQYMCFDPAVSKK